MKIVGEPGGGGGCGGGVKGVGGGVTGTGLLPPPPHPTSISVHNINTVIERVVLPSLLECVGFLLLIANKETDLSLNA